MLFRRSGPPSPRWPCWPRSLSPVAVPEAAPAPPPPAAPQGNPPIKVVTSTNVYGSIARAVGGDRVDVTSLINDPQADPHSYETTPGDAAKVATANVILYNGGGYDDFMERLVQSSGGKAVSIDVTALSGLDPAAGAGGADAASNPYFNEHLWYSLPTVQKVADQLATDFGAADPADADLFTANAQAFKGQVGEPPHQGAGDRRRPPRRPRRRHRAGAGLPDPGRGAHRRHAAGVRARDRGGHGPARGCTPADPRLVHDTIR